MGHWSCVLVLLSLPSLATAATLSNDTCAGATVIPPGPFPYVTEVISDITDATTNSDPPYPSCALSGLTNSVWFKFSPTNTALYRISTCSDTDTTIDDTVMAIYRSSSSGCGTLTEVGCTDDACGLRAAITNTLTSGRTYFIVVWRFSLSGGPPNGTALQLRISRPVQPTNDICSGATTIPAAGPFPYLSPVADVTLTSTTGDPPAPDCQPDVANSVWYKFKPATNGVYRFSDCGETGTTVEDTIMAVYSSTTPCGGTYTQLACSDDDCGLHSSLALPLNTNTTYYILLWSFAQNFAGSGEMQLRVSRTTPPGIPSPVSINSGLTTAALQGLITPNEGHVTGWFEWGTTTNYGALTSPQTLGAGVNVILSDALQGLNPSSSYHVRLVATNEAGIVRSPDFLFQTAPRPQITAYSFLTNGDFRLQFTGPTNETYRVLASTDLIDWLEIGAPDPIGSNLLQFDDPSPTETSKFYRIISP